MSECNSSRSQSTRNIRRNNSRKNSKKKQNTLTCDKNSPVSQMEEKSHCFEKGDRFLQVGGSGEEWEGLGGLMPASAKLLLPTAEEAPVALFGNQVCRSWSVWLFFFQPPKDSWVVLMVIRKNKPQLKHLKTRVW